MVTSKPSSTNSPKVFARVVVYRLSATVVSIGCFYQVNDCLDIEIFRWL